MKKILSMCVLAICCSTLIISCSKDSTENPDQPSKKYRLTKVVYDDGYMENYYYNTNGQLRKISDSDGSFIEFFYNSERKLTKVSNDSWNEEYYYKNGILDFITFSSELHSDLPDTVFFKYNSINQISQLIDSYSFNGTTRKYTYVFTYDNKDRLIAKVQKQMDNLSPAFDSTIYKWNSGDNLLEMRHIYNYTADGITYNVELVQENYEYDSYLNYSSTIPYPESYLIKEKFMKTMGEEFSINNVIEIRHKTENGSYTRLYYVTESDNGLPKRIVGEYASWVITYEKI